MTRRCLPDADLWPHGSSEMAKHVRNHAWAATALGPIGNWSTELKSAVSFVLDTAFPSALVWGPDLVTIYNDAFRPILGDKPEPLGRSFADIWSETWPDIEPIVARAFAGASTFIENYPLVVSRHRDPEQAYFTFSYSPVRAANGTVLGMIDTVIETTHNVLTSTRLRESEERQAFLLKLSDALRPLADPVEIKAAAASVVGRHFKVGRCGYGTVDAAGEYFTIERDWTDGTMASEKATHRIADFVALTDNFRTGEMLVIEDALTDPRTRDVRAAYRAAGAPRASLSVPLLKEGHWVASFYIQQISPRKWTEEEEAILHEVAQRTWAAVERARAQAALRESEQRQQILIGELQHRTRNLIAVIRSMANKTARTSADLIDFSRRFRDRLEALSRVQGLLSRGSESERITLDELIRSELSAIEGGTERVTIAGSPDVGLRPSMVQVLALAIHELATNAMKYGALSQQPAPRSARKRQQTLASYLLERKRCYNAACWNAARRKRARS